ncbi:dihydroxyacetone kinase 1-like [Trypanosoma theileri]|uniref:Dihydroxyacetone kinase 1-like n=1 Tax=Trypanosoma theileri TaxID=67003 RepID=A0A1X0P659_9TRYP|nr:dihydroxyacetone kinase 1-like [Trypanosoma theileri]ORC92123.1 dihydroxyacetone kinase 1-like [Trypanosoma theileri]
MTSTKFIDSADTALDTAIKALCMSKPQLQVIENTHVVVNSQLDPKKVLIVCGGGAGHEPSHVGYVADGWLSAAVSGGVFASPPYAHVRAAINYLYEKQGPNGPGILIVVKNYFGDILNFEFAVQEARGRGISVAMVLSADDACFGVDDITRRRGIAGTVLLNKILCTAAQKGESLTALQELAGRISAGIRSIGASLSSCSLPGAAPTATIPVGSVEVGLGIHGEKGLYQQPFKGAKELVTHLLDILLGSGDQKQSWKGAEVALVVNNLGSTTDLEMGILSYHALQYLSEAGVNVVGISVGRYMTALEMHGFSLTILRFSNHDDIKYLFGESQSSLMPFNVPKLTVTYVPGPSTALQIAQKEGKYKSHPAGLMNQVAEAIFQSLKGSENYLNALDAAVGDGDLGSGIKRAALKVLELLPYLPWEEDVGKTFSLLAEAVADACGGTSGPLCGAFLLGIGTAVSEEMKKGEVHAVELIRKGLKGGSASVQRLGRAKRGDRTMVDVLEEINMSPAVTSATSLQDLAVACVEAAKKGAAATAQLPAKHGRSRYMQGKEIGRQDPGAELVVLWVESAADVLLSKK